MSDERRSQDRRPDDWLFDTLSRMEATEQRHASESRIRSEVISSKLDVHAEEDRKIAKAIMDRILVIETERKDEEKLVARRGAWAGILAATGLEVIVMSVKHFAGWK